MKTIQLVLFVLLGVAVVNSFPREREVEPVEREVEPVEREVEPVEEVGTTGEAIPSYFGFLPDFDLLSRIRGLVTRLRSQIGVSFGDIDWNKGNTTSTTKVIDGHVVTVNETSYKDDDSDLVLHVKVIDVKPTEGVEDTIASTDDENNETPDATNDNNEDNEIPNKPEEDLAESLEYDNQPEETREIRDNLYENSMPVEDVENDVEEIDPAMYNRYPIPLHNDLRVNKILADKGEMNMLNDVEMFVPDNRDVYVVNSDREYVYNPAPVYQSAPYNDDREYVYNPAPVYQSAPYAGFQHRPKFERLTSLTRDRIAIEKLSEVVDEMLCDSDCSELSWNEDSNDEIIYSDNVTVHATDGRNIRTSQSRTKAQVVGTAAVQPAIVPVEPEAPSTLPFPNVIGVVEEPPPSRDTGNYQLTSVKIIQTGTEKERETNSNTQFPIFQRSDGPS
ncbi:hypothetical protein L9F63_011472 [Diploptera punctata]|uniref:Uncharacterized protein n=1 Tax=Diploptera punctata TaxID=6984 RepID=A0AAD8ENV7_DIPPU|nr:hypothetical protein L9F63_011472 [Diploptera punctata]